MVCLASSRQLQLSPEAIGRSPAYGYDDTRDEGPGRELESDDCPSAYDYDPHGKPSHDRGAPLPINPFRLSTKYHHAYSGLHYYGFRFYSPGQGRFLNRDPINEPGSQLVRDVKKEGGLAEEKNLYAFVANDPVNAWDYLGLRRRYDGRLPSQYRCGVTGRAMSPPPRRTLEGLGTLLDYFGATNAQARLEKEIQKGLQDCEDHRIELGLPSYLLCTTRCCIITVTATPRIVSWRFSDGSGVFVQSSCSDVENETTISPATPDGTRRITIYVPF